MGLTFLKEHGAHRAGPGDGQADLFGDLNAPPEELNSDEEAVDLDYEIAQSQWAPRSVRQSLAPNDWYWRPLRFVDGKDVGRTAAWMRAPCGRPVPLRIGQIGAITLGSVPRDETHLLRTETCFVDKFVAFMTDLFPWDEVESFAAALKAQGYRLLPVTAELKEKISPFDYGRLRDSAKSASINAMLGYEREVLAAKLYPAVPKSLPTVIDGSLQTKAGDFEPTDPVSGVIKSHQIIPLHPRGFQTLEQLGPGERSPVYERIVKPNDETPLHFLTWFLRLGALGGETPLQGLVRVEINREFFEQQQTSKDDFSYVDCLSRFLCLCRTRDEQYGRAAITIYPIQRAEDVLRSQFASQETLTNRFFRMTGL